MTFAAVLRRPDLPATTPLPRGLDVALAVALAAYGFFIPFSVAGTSLMLAVLLLFVLACAPRVWRSRPWREPTMAVGLVLFAWIGLHTLLIDGALRSLRMPLVSYKELLLAPMLFALFRLTSRPAWFFRALVAGTLAWAAVSWSAVWSEHMALVLGPHRISASFEFALLAFVLLEHGRRTARPWPARIGAAFLALTVLFAMEGRTGQLIVLLLLAVSAWLHVPRRWRIAALVLTPVLVAALALGSGAVQRRMAETTSAIEKPEQVPTTSTGIRVELVKHGLTLVREHWLLGAGFNHYSQLHQDAVRRAYANDPVRREQYQSFWARTPNPHDEYVMQVVGGGVVSLALFLGWLAMPLLRRLPDGHHVPVLQGAVVAFAVGCLFNSLLLDFVEGHYYTALLAWLLAREATPRA
ncbi:O-antigen ligase family protein [Ramlibacter sp. MMS24-I3-19]|uniref:O-antigen ligase family protein n=1 Tax=Ramlibacter sp. MMS24-I3-19 TaxID=3416606 RepID=UPI003CFDFB2F